MDLQVLDQVAQTERKLLPIVNVFIAGERFIYPDRVVKCAIGLGLDAQFIARIGFGIECQRGVPGPDILKNWLAITSSDGDVMP